MFQVYKPKGKRVNAEQVSLENAASIVKKFNGRIKTEDPKNPGDEPTVLGIELPTFAGARFIALNSWLVQSNEGFEVMDDEKFNEAYELARNTRAA